MRPFLHALHELLVGDRARFAAAVVALVVASCLLYVAPLMPQLVIDGVLAPADQASPGMQRAVAALGGRTWLREHLWAPAAWLVAITVAAGVFTYLRGRLSSIASENTIRRLRERLYDDHRIEVPVTVHEGRVFVRVSVQAYTEEADLAALERALERILAG